MDSDCDMFSSQPLAHEGKKTIENSCPAQVFSFGYVVLFNWDETAKKPFKIFPHKAFAKEIGTRCIEKEIPDQMRMKQLKPLKALPGLKMSLFAKIESCKLYFKI